MRLLYACGVGLTVVGLAFGAEPATRVFVTTPAEGLSAALARVRSQRAAGTAVELRLETGIYRRVPALCR